MTRQLHFSIFEENPLLEIEFPLLLSKKWEFKWELKWKFKVGIVDKYGLKENTT